MNIANSLPWGQIYRLGVARPFLMLKALFLILPLILPFKH
jgi:hypothetical protein